ncbi:MAG: hypothetical protein DSY37_04720 [Hyperthermus sp.]|nr:MAG: hypothetical protein DSY37_04720 [Hyperthermus sp.]
MRRGGITILVVGLLEQDSGKTWLGTSIAYIGAEQVKTGAYKPVGGFNVWYSYRALRESLNKYSVIAGGDALNYARITGQDIREVNPIALALAFPDPASLSGAASYLTRASSLQSSLIMARFSTPTSTTHYLAADNLKLLPAQVKNEVREIAEKLKAIPVNADQILSLLQNPIIEDALNTVLKGIVDSNELVVIESFNNALLPYMGLDLDLIDFIIVTAPGKALLYSGDKLRLLDRLMSLKRYSRVDQAYPLLGKPLTKTDLPPATTIEEFWEKMRSNPLIKKILP